MKIERLYIEDEVTAGFIWRLQHAAYAVEASLTGFLNLPPLMDTITTLRLCGETFYGVRSEEDDPFSDVIAAIAYETDGERLVICRMMVHPDFFRRGIARRLITFVESMVTNEREIVVSTGSKNEPAIRLYEAMGFRFVREWMPVLGLMVTEFTKSCGKGEVQHEQSMVD